MATALLLAMPLMIRNVYGALTVILTGGAFLPGLVADGPQVQAGFAYTAVWFLLLGGVRPVFELQARRAARGGRGLGRRPARPAFTNVPAALWLFLFHAVSLCSLIGGPLAARSVICEAH